MKRPTPSQKVRRLQKALESAVKRQRAMLAGLGNSSHPQIAEARARIAGKADAYEAVLDALQRDSWLSLGIDT